MLERFKIGSFTAQEGVSVGDSITKSVLWTHGMDDEPYESTGVRQCVRGRDSPNL